MICGALAAELERDRARYNALFAAERRCYPQLQQAAFFAFLSDTVDPIVAAVAEVDPGAAARLVPVLYEQALILVARGHAERYPAISEGWRVLLAGIAAQLASAPRRLAGSVTNALHNISREPGARPGLWIDGMLRIGEAGADASVLLEAGKVLAWRSGLAHYREGALEACRRLPESIARIALGIGLPTSGVDGFAAALDRLSADPWLHPESSETAPGERRPAIVARIGAFRGFGGVFVQPPRVTTDGERLYAADAGGNWLIAADIFGATFHRAAESPPDQDLDTAPPLSLEPGGLVRAGSEYAAFHELKDPTSVACAGCTLAVTVRHSHSIYLAALTG